MHVKHHGCLIQISLVGPCSQSHQILQDTTWKVHVEKCQGVNCVVQIFLQVINWQQCLHIPSQAQLSKDASDFILRLCIGSEERLGKNGVLDIKSHPFFQTIEFDSNIRKMKAPYTPTVRHPTDTSNFPESPERVGSNSSTDSWDSNPSEGEPYREQPDHAFLSSPSGVSLTTTGIRIRCRLTLTRRPAQREWSVPRVMEQRVTTA